MKRRAQPWLGTLVDITINDTASNADEDGRLDRCINEAFGAIATVHRLMSFHDVQSDVSKINRAGVGEVIVIAADTVTVLSAALMLHSASDGIFNINTASQLIDWGLLPDAQYARPTDGDTNSGLIIEDAQHVRKTGVMTIDLGGIAKGYAVDCAIAVLRSAGIQSACVNAGGDLRVLGAVPFSVSIRDPVTITTAARQVAVANTALATSAPYFSRREHGGRQVSALVDGRSGIAITQSVSVSVIAPDCMMADALTKIVIASGDPQHFLLNRFGAHAFMIGETSC